MRRAALAVALLSPWVAACATAPLPPSCVALRGVGAVPVRFADGKTRLAYTYADEPARLAHLRCRADQGERAAAVDLARAYETGAGVPRDDARAAALYEAAARDRPAYTSIYAPPMRLGGSGQVLLLPTGGGPGDAKAKYRLGRMLIEGRGVGRDEGRGRSLIAAAERQGFRP